MGLSIVNITFITQFGGFEDCASTNSFPCTFRGGSTTGGVNLKIRAWSLKPFLSYKVKLVDTYSNMVEFPIIMRYKRYTVTELNRATWQTVTVNKVDNFSLALEENFGYWGATLPIGSWDYAAGITDVFLYEQAHEEHF